MILKALLGVWSIFLIGLVLEAEGTAEIMSHVTAGFGKALEECREESGLSKEIMEEFHHFWRKDFEVVHRELGCAIICMSNKFSIIKEDTRIHHTNMDAWIKTFPQGEDLSAKMVNMIHECEKRFENENIEDNCSRVVKEARCFKEDCIKEGIAPDMATMEAVLDQYK